MQRGGLSYPRDDFFEQNKSALKSWLVRRARVGDSGAQPYPQKIQTVGNLVFLFGFNTRKEKQGRLSPCEVYFQT
ncbi:hypothetical protein H249_5262 [Klebsiella pneumoniae VAKPC270]|nr:hypothetical protein [Salmonella enterica]EIW8783504.1 hypothetical protein [Klebsiella pneumoniae]EOZ38157.1 hypothetical protein H249_5262 [Klebsiella pneumoniae VAKPC270]EOZ46128.1 hypothetical protein H250_5207 [Klebsiella pneumoniae VAKPC276]EOZ64287.1 hypothetical protein H252_5322 [Klebsiella pneumoniae VAKPC309]RBL15719.1 hypothetical protein CCZ10_25115 [Escherichia coli]ROA22679.1 hypothetical protein C5X64_026945 [Klebsiella pneumoniae subsp. pneumoniae]